MNPVVKPGQTWDQGLSGTRKVVTYYVAQISIRVRRRQGHHELVPCAQCTVGATAGVRCIDLDEFRPPRYRLVRDENGKRVPVDEEED